MSMNRADIKNAGDTPPKIASLTSLANVEKELAGLPSSESSEKTKALITKIAMLHEVRSFE